MKNYIIRNKVLITLFKFRKLNTAAGHHTAQLQKHDIAKEIVSYKLGNL